MEQVDFPDWQKIDLRVGKILNVAEVDGADKLLKLEVDIGEENTKTILAGIKKYYSKDELMGKNIVVFCNLEPRKMKGIESQGMLLAATSEDKSKVILLQPESDIKPGAKIS
ncbi:methionine--tRNA ligase subunit beta [Candidatus Woesearchaeota archaeon CG10_big_fil_rev_8_21_14_0_10_34_12]|nr:MAG: methionine--tRNA ligase subunit beta [Candidatus Woesearchaeota archaeon CG10_big_fil_rev_8_21_14_0_10_34_12]